MPVLFLTGQSSLEKMTAAVSNGCYAYIEKPADPEEVKRQVETIFHQHYKTPIEQLL